MIVCPRRSAGRRRLANFAANRHSNLQALLDAEVAKAAAEALRAAAAASGSPSSPSRASCGFWGEDERGSPCKKLHPQCRRDFDRADYMVGEAHFSVGAAARGESGCGYDSFVMCIEELCCSEALVYAVSATASQLAMAHLATVCFSGPHSYAVPAGHTLPKYVLRRRGDSSDVVIDIERVSAGFEYFSLPGGEPCECHKTSLIQHHARVVLRPVADGDASAGESVTIEVEDVWECMRVAWPDQGPVLHDGLPLDFRSPPLTPDRSSCWAPCLVPRGLAAIAGWALRRVSSLAAAAAMSCMAGISKIPRWVGRLVPIGGLRAAPRQQGGKDD